MEQGEKTPTGTTDGAYTAKWERTFNIILTPLEEFVHRQTSSSLLLVIATITALILANSGFADLYAAFITTPLGISFGPLSLEKDLLHWVNDGLMAIFFFVVGLELKREFLAGELADPRNAALPIIAAIGGMVIPAGLYALMNMSGDGTPGWAIPMATDIAFAIGALILFGARVPTALMAFLVALAIVDDLGAISVIALFYTEQISMLAIGLAVIIFAIMLSFNYGGIRSPWPYMIGAAFLWLALLSSGIHATIAGVLGALTIPVRPKYDADRFKSLMESLLNQFTAATRTKTDMLGNEDARAVLQTMENGVHGVQTPLQRLEHVWHFPVAYLILPFFAFINAGVPIGGGVLSASMESSITWGIIVGLVLGKGLGVAGVSYLAIRLGWAKLPTGVNFGQILGVSFLSGIGFTMSIFIADLAFNYDVQLLTQAKMGILLASVLAGAAGLVILHKALPTAQKSSAHSESATAT